MEWTAETVRKELPRINGIFQGEHHECRIVGRLCDYAKVFPLCNPNIDAEYSWASLARILNAGGTVKIG